jgi:hypothetical protein
MNNQEEPDNGCGLKKDSYQGVASATPTKAKGHAALQTAEKLLCGPTLSLSG